MYFHTSQKNKPQLLNKLDGISLSDLKKIKKSYYSYRQKVNEYAQKLRQAQLEREKISASNSAARLRMEQWERQNINPLTNELQRLLNVLHGHRLGLIKKTFMRSIQFEGEQYDPSARDIVQQIDKARRLLGEAYDRKPPYEGRQLTPVPQEPRTTSTFVVGGQKLRIDFVKIKISELDGLIEKHENKINENKTRTSELKARAALTEPEKRRQAQGFRRSLSKQLSLINSCPYCERKLNNANAHLDHIYPISKGGHSSEKNLIFVCADCNITKSDMTLRKFLKSKGYNETEVYGRLEALKKDF